MLTLKVIPKTHETIFDDHVLKDGSPRLTLRIISNDTGKKPRIGKYTLSIFLERSLITHGYKFDYSQVTETHIKNTLSRIPVICNTCKHNWQPTITNHILNKRGCPSCAGLLPWTLDRFLTCGTKIHENKYDYSQVTEFHIKSKESKIPITCRTCAYIWSPSIHGHITGKTGCPNCANNAPWSLDRFLIKARQIHGDKYDYSRITKSNIKGKESPLPVTCNKCSYEWNPVLHHHINGKHGCPNCAGVAPWTLEKVLSEAVKVYGNKFNYSQVKEFHIKGDQSNIPVICNECNNQWNPTINNHIREKSRCPHCSKKRGYSYGQLAWIESIMSSENINIQYPLSAEGEYKIPGVGKVDGFCHETNTVYEYHGDFWHGNPKRYEAEAINKINGRTYGELYIKTIERDEKIKKLGYNLIVKWET